MSDRKMDPKTYIMTQMRILEMAKIADSLDIETFLQCINTAKTAAPLLDPTLYMKAANNIDAIERLAKIALQFKKELVNARVAFFDTLAKGHMNTEPTTHEVEAMKELENGKGKKQ